MGEHVVEGVCHVSHHAAPSAASKTGTTHASQKMGPWQATALVVGSIVGVGIFSLPYSLASYGPISLVALVIASIGAIALALVFAGLSRRLARLGWALRLRPDRLRQHLGLRQRLVLLDHRLGRQRGHRGRLGLLRRALRQQGREHDGVDPHRPGRPVDSRPR